MNLLTSLFPRVVKLSLSVGHLLDACPAQLPLHMLYNSAVWTGKYPSVHLLTTCNLTTLTTICV